MKEFALIKSRVNLNRVNLGIALISDLKVYEVCTMHNKTTLCLKSLENDFKRLGSNLAKAVDVVYCRLLIYSYLSIASRDKNCCSTPYE